MLADAQSAHKKPSATRIRPPRDGCHVFKAGLRTFEGGASHACIPTGRLPTARKLQWLRPHWLGWRLKPCTVADRVHSITVAGAAPDSHRLPD